MASSDLFNIAIGVIGTIIGIVGLIFSWWVWMKSNLEKHELVGAISAIDDIAEATIWEWESIAAEDTELKLRQAEKNYGVFTSIKKLAVQFAPHRSQSVNESFIYPLIKRNILWTMAMIWDLEGSKETKEVWLVTPDLKPDNSNTSIGKIVGRNIINRGKKYVYFYPDDLPHIEREVTKLISNIGLVDSQNKKFMTKLTLVPLSRSQYGQLFVGGNIVFYFRDAQRVLSLRCFEEVVLTRYPERGAFWQEHAENKASELQHLLEPELLRISRSDINKRQPPSISKQR